MSAILVPFCGIIVDVYGGRASFLVFCSLLIMAVHLTLGLTFLNPIIPLVFLGLSYSMYGVAIWPSIATIVEHQETKLSLQFTDPPKLVGTAFGISTSVLNAALTIFPIISAGIRVDGGSFVPVELFFAGLALGGALTSLLLWYVDLKNDSVLQKAEKDYEVGDTPGTEDSLQEEEHVIAQNNGNDPPFANDSFYSLNSS
jgi:MFS family permease